MSTIENAKTMLPLVPIEVFDGFFAPIINDIGWPFTNIYDHLYGTDWHRIFYPLSLLDMHNLIWETRQIILDWDMLYHVSQDDINLVIQNKTEDVLAQIGMDSKPSRQSLAWHSEYIANNKRVSAPVTLAQTPEGIKILDGNHRVSALFDMRVETTIPLDAWIGLP